MLPPHPNSSRSDGATAVASVERPERRWPLLVCPYDGMPLSEQGQGHGVTCADGHSWERAGGILRMVSERRNYSDAFGLQWKRFRRTQLDSHNGTTLSTDRARRCLGDDSWRYLTSNPDAQILEVGCGAGRFTEVLLATGCHVTSVDLSDAVEANQENFPQDDRHRILQADVRRLPFAPRQYDVVFCLGVVQHTPDPEETIRCLFDQVRPGGWLVIDHYRRSLARIVQSAVLLRQLFRHLPAGEGLKWSRRLVDIFLPVHNALRGSLAAQRILSRISPIAACQYLPLTEELRREWAILDTHDSLTDWYKHYRTKGQIAATLKELGGIDVWCEDGGNGVEARCRRAAPGT